MTMRFSLAAALSLALVAPALAADPTYKIVDRIKMPDGYWDYGTSDPDTRRIYWARAAYTDVIDVQTGKLSQLKNIGGGHLAVPAPGTTLVVTPLRDPKSTVRISNAATDKVVADLPAGDAPDGATYDPFSKHVYVANHNSSDMTVVDPVGARVVATIPIGGGKLEFPAADGLGHVFVAVQASGEIAVIDVKSNKTTGRYALEGCRDASGLAYATKSKLLIAACGNGVAKVVAADAGKDVATIPIGKGPDAVIYDPVREVAFIPSGVEGVLQVISVADAAHVALVQTLPTQILARSGAVDPQSGKLYLMAAQPDPSKPTGGGGRPTPKDGTFEMLVIAPQ
jgi:YVTN family beta-propeller protein